MSSEPNVLTDDHPLVHLRARLDEQRTAFLEVEHRIRGATPGRSAPTTRWTWSAGRRTRARTCRTRGGRCRNRGSRSGSRSGTRSARARTTNSIRTHPVPWLVMCSMRPLRLASSCVTAPRYSSGRVDGEAFDGLVTAAVDHAGDDPRLADGQLVSPPDAWSRPGSPAPAHRGPGTSQASGRSVGSTRIETLPTSSWSSRSLTSRDVTLVPPYPPGQRRGVGADGHRQRGFVDGDQRQRMRVDVVGQRLPDHDSGNARDGDDVARAGLTRPAPGRGRRSSTARRLTRSTEPSCLHQATRWPFRISPSRTRHRAIRPRNGEASRLVTCACSGAPSLNMGAGMAR